MERARNESGPGSFRELVKIAVPLILSSGSISLMNVVDRMFLTWYSTEALAAVMPAGMLFFAAISLPLGIATYVTTFVAQYDGAESRGNVSAVIWQGIYLSLGVGLLMLLVAPLAGPVFVLANHPESVRAFERQYFQILCFGAAPLLIADVLSGFFNGRGRTLPVMKINFVGAALNGVLDYLLIFGAGPIPSLGIRGAAIATVSSQAVMVLMYVLAIRTDSDSAVYALMKHARFCRSLFARLIRFGSANGLMYLTEISAFAVFTFMVGSLGTEQLAASNLTFNLNSFVFIPLMGWGTAVMTIVGRRVGEGRPELAVRSTWLAAGTAVSFTLCSGTVFVVFPESILFPFEAFDTGGDVAAIRDLVIILLRFVAVFGVMDALAFVFGSALRGAGDVRFPVLFSLGSSWLLMVLPTFLACYWWQGNIYHCWTACMVHIMVMGGGFFWRFQAGHWKSMRVIEHDIVPQRAESLPAAEPVHLDSRSLGCNDVTGKSDDHLTAGPRTTDAADCRQSASCQSFE